VVTRRRRERGFTLLEITVALAIFGFFVVMSAILQSEMMRYDRKMPVNFMSHPQVASLVSRMRRDVEDATNPYYPESYETYTQSSETLILYSLDPTGAKTIVWDFSQAGVARRRVYNVGNLASEWIARGIPVVTIGTAPSPGKTDPVRITALDAHGHLAIDQIFQPRAHE
jgi:prepilin-type N-terminal cleavage/methylation domain-containing protein